MTGGAWLSSARVVRCWVKSRNERNPCCQLPASKVGDSGETAGDNSEEGGDDVKSSCPLCLGLHTCYNGCNKGKRPCKRKRISEKQSQFGLWAATRPHEVGLQTSIRTETDFLSFAPHHCLASRCIRHCSTCVAQVIRGMMI